MNLSGGFCRAEINGGTDGDCTHFPGFANELRAGGVVVTDGRYIRDLQFGGLAANRKPPNTLAYTGNVVLSLPTHSAFVPYVTGGIGGLTMFEKASLGFNKAETFLTGNAGGGVKWYAPNGRWGLRGDYRFIAVRASSDATAFFNQDTRYGHRVYAAVIINALR